MKNVDLVLNTVDADTNARSIGVVREGGMLVSVVGSAERRGLCRRENPSAPGRIAKPAPSNADMLARVVELADAGKFKVFVDEHLRAGRRVEGLGQEPRRPHARQTHHQGVGRADDEAQ